MRLRAVAGCAVVALLALAGCDREPVRTVVLHPETRAPAAPGSATVPPAPQATSSAPVVASPPLPAASEAPPASTAPAPAPPRPKVDAQVREAGDPEGARLLAARTLIVPVEGIPAASLMDMYEEKRGGQRKHEAIDIVAPKGTRVLAVDDGVVAKLFTSVPGGLTLYQFDREGKLAYYYAHLDRYAEGLKEGMALKRGDTVGYVGITGNAPPGTPHLHFAVFRLGPEKQWWKGEPVNPYPALRNAAG